MISDIIIIAIIVLFTILGFRRGIARTLLNLAAVTANSIISNYVAAFLANVIYTNFFQQTVIDNIQKTINQYGLDTAISSSLQSAPSWATGILSAVCELLGMNLSSVQDSLTVTNEQTLTIAQNIEKPVGEISVSVLSFVLVIVVFALLMILFKYLIKLALRVFEISVVKQVNHALGAIAGLLEGIVFVCFAINVFYVILAYANPSLIGNSTVFGTIFNTLCLFR